MNTDERNCAVSNVGIHTSMRRSRSMQSVTTMLKSPKSPNKSDAAALLPPHITSPTAHSSWSSPFAQPASVRWPADLKLTSMLLLSSLLRTLTGHAVKVPSSYAGVPLTIATPYVLGTFVVNVTTLVLGTGLG